MDINNIFWLAGILEGEGSFGHQQSIKIELRMTDEDIVIKVRNMMAPNNNIYVQKPPEGKNNWKTLYVLNISGCLAAQWMMTLYQLMGVRRKEKIRLVLKFWKSQTQRQKGIDYCPKGHPLLIEKSHYYNITNISGNTSKVCKACEKNKKLKVRSKESLSRIAKKLGMSEEALELANENAKLINKNIH